MYTDGIYRVTLDSTYGTDIKVYDNIEEAEKYEEIQ